MSTVLSPSSPSSCSSSGSPHQTSSIIVHMANASHSSASSSFNTTPEHPSPELSVSSSSYVVPPPPSPLHPSSPSPSPTRLLHHAHSPHHPSFSNHDPSYYHTQTSIDSSPPPYTETMTSTGSTSTGRLRADSTADSVDSFKPRAENVPFQHHPHYEHHHHHHPHLPSRYEESSSSIAMQSSSYSSRPSSSRDYSTQQTARLPKDEAAYTTTDHTGKEKKLGHRRVGEDGQITYKRLPSEQIMYSIQLGIGHSIGSLASKPERDVLYNDFNTVETVLFPARGSTSTPAHHFSDFEFTTYTPNAFRHFRDLFRIQPDDYMLSITNEPLMELSNPGASGSVFYRTADDQFIIKTVEKNESKFLLKLLPGYYMNLSQNPLTLLPKFFGLYTYECAGKNIRIIIMNNLLPSTIVMHEKYDLKGSTYKRKASDAEKEKKAPTYKDLDFLERYRLMENFKKSTATLYSKGTRESEEGVSFLVPGAGGVGVGVGVGGGENAEEAGQGGLQLEGHVYDELVNTLQRDCRVLESFEIMDYSLLIGVHNYDRQVKEHPEKVHFDYEDDTRLPDGAIRATNPQGERLLLFVGIIDILQSYRLFKKVEHAWKALLHDGDTVSVHRPKFYARRFLNFAIKYVFARQSPPAGASRPDKYSYYYTVAENQKKFGFNSLNRSRNGHTFYGAPFR